MQLERRKYDRKPCHDKILLLKKENGRVMEQKPLYLRDVSSGGMSGTYFGSDIPKPGELFWVKNGKCDVSRCVKLVWTHKSIEAVYMLGFSYQDETSA